MTKIVLLVLKRGKEKDGYANFRVYYFNSSSGNGMREGNKGLTYREKTMRRVVAGKRERRG